MATDLPSPSAKRVRIETYDSDADSPISEISSSSELGSEIVDLISTSSTIELSDGSNDPTVFMAKDGTKWKELIPDDVPRDHFSPNTVNHFPKFSDKCQNVKLLTGNLFLYYQIISRILSFH